MSHLTATDGANVDAENAGAEQLIPATVACPVAKVPTFRQFDVATSLVSRNSTNESADRVTLDVCTAFALLAPVETVEPKSASIPWLKRDTVEPK